MVVQIFSFFVRQLLSRLWEVSKQLSPHAAHFSRPFLPPLLLPSLHVVPERPHAFPSPRPPVRALETDAGAARARPAAWRVSVQCVLKASKSLRHQK